MFDDDIAPEEDRPEPPVPADTPGVWPAEPVRNPRVPADTPDAWVLSVGELHCTAPGPELALLLANGTMEEADDAALVEAVAAWQRMASWAAAGAARAAAALAERPSMNPDWPDSAGDVKERNVAGEELAMRLSCSRRAARTLVRHGRAFDGTLSLTGQALARGELDLGKARLLVEALDREAVPVELALDVQQAVLPGAGGWTPTQLARQIAGALIAADPAGATARHDAACRGRRIDRPRVLPDGMAGIWAVLDAADAVRLDAHIDAVARAMRNDGDPRTLDQLRADILVGVTDGTLTAPPVIPAGSSSEEHGVGSPVPSTGDGAATHARAARPRPTRSQIRVTVPLSSLIGTDDAAGDLAGYGPVTAETARALALGGVWRRLVTDSTSGTVLDVGRTRYRPPADLAEHVRTRDRTCARAGCSADADACDLDHTVEFHRDGGRTSHDSMSPLCPRDHAVKTDGGFHVTQVRPGVFRWVTPTGHVYVVQPGTGAAREHRPPDRPPF